jgi:glycosyltransferase involved in cell wall biosynthesis
VARVRQRLRIDAPFVLYVGNLKPHKNLERLLDAVERLWSSGVEDVGLLVVGGEISTLQSLRRAVGDRRHQRVRFLGPVDAGALSVLYRLASVFAFPSLCEGFGLPPLEAMACGTPVVTSNVSSLPEVTGGAALLVDPYDVESIAAGLRSVLTDAALADRLRRQGIEQARTFSWERSAARTRQIYASVGGG